MSLWKFWDFGYKIGVISLFIFLAELSSEQFSKVVYVVAVPFCWWSPHQYVCAEWIVEVPRHIPHFGNSLRFMIAGSVWSSIHSLFCFLHFGTHMRCKKSSWTSHLRFLSCVFSFSPFRTWLIQWYMSFLTILLTKWNRVMLGQIVVQNSEVQAHNIWHFFY